MKEINIKEFKEKHGLKTVVQPEIPNNVSSETVERIVYATNVAFVYFAMTNMEHFQQIKKNPDYWGNWDCSGITKSDRKFIVKFKVRNALAVDYMYKTIIESSKLKALWEFQKQHPDFTVKYISYFNDFGISFNLSSRFLQGANSDILASYDFNLKRSYYNTSQSWNQDKLVNFLGFNAGLWHDKIIKY